MQIKPSQFHSQNIKFDYLILIHPHSFIHSFQNRIKTTTTSKGKKLRMGKRAGKKRTEKKRLIYAIKQAKIRDEERSKFKGIKPPQNLPSPLSTPPPTRALPRIREECTMVGLPPLIKVTRVPPMVQKPPSPEDILNLFPEELDRDLGWSPDEFDREYFRLWEEEREKEYRRKRDKKRRKIVGLFGMDSDTEREIEGDKRRDLEVDLFGEVISSDEEVIERKEGVEGMQVDEESKEEEVEEVERMQVDEESKEEEVEEVERMEVEEEREKVMEMKIKEKAKEGAGASRMVVPNKIRGHWLKSKTRLDLSTPLY